MFKLRTLAFLAALLTGLSPAVAQQFPTVPDHSVIGRIGTGSGSGPSQAIPFANLQAALIGIQSANTVYAGPSSGSQAVPGFRALVGADLPNPGASSLGGVKSLTCASHNWLNSISIAGQPVCAQPAFSDLSGNISVSQMNSGTGASSSTFWRGDGTWVTAGGTGTVTSVTCGTGLSGGTITTTGTCAVNLTTITNSLGSDVTMSPANAYYDGPSVAQGSSGVWFASGTVSLTDTASSQFICKLWDGTNVAASGSGRIATSGSAAGTMSLSGTFTSPPGNIRISCQTNSTSSKIVFNASGNSKDSTITAHRIQ